MSADEAIADPRITALAIAPRRDIQGSTRKAGQGYRARNMYQTWRTIWWDEAGDIKPSGRCAEWRAYPQARTVRLLSSEQAVRAPSNPNMPGIIRLMPRWPSAINVPKQSRRSGPSGSRTRLTAVGHRNIALPFEPSRDSYAQAQHRTLRGVAGTKHRMLLRPEQ